MKALALSLILIGSAANASVCEISGEGLSFSKTTVQADKEYRSIEEATTKGIKFMLKAGHGVARLEAHIAGVLVASTFYSYGRSPAETDSLRLEVRAPMGELVEAQCYGVDSVVP